MAYNNCLVTLPNYTLLATCAYVKGGISGLGIFLDGHGVTDFTQESQWSAALSANTCRIIGGCDRNVRVEIPAPTPDTLDNPSACSEQPILVGFTYTANVEDGNVNAQNDVFYAALSTARDLTVVPYMCDQDRIRVIDHDVVVYSPSMPTIPFSKKELQKYFYTFTWYVSAGQLAGELLAPPDNIFC